MTATFRFLLAMVVFACWYIFTYRVPSLLIPALPELGWFANVALVAAVTIGFLVWTGSKRLPAALIPRILWGAAVVWGVGFAAAVLSGPFLFPAKPNQGVLLGLLITGPAGALAGGLGVLVVWLRANSGRAADPATTRLR